MKRTLATISLLILSALPCLAGPEESAVQVSRIEWHDDDTGRMLPKGGGGSGTVVRSGAGESLVLTCRHVCPNGNGYHFVRAGSRVHLAEWVAADTDADLALLRVRAELPAAGLADREPDRGGEARQWGHDGGRRATHRAGRLAGTETVTLFDGGRPEPPYEFRVADYFVEPGASGAGVFDAAGRLVGVCAGRHEQGRKAFLVRLTDVRRFVGSHTKKGH